MGISQTTPNPKRHYRELPSLRARVAQSSFRDTQLHTHRSSHSSVTGALAPPRKMALPLAAAPARGTLLTGSRLKKKAAHRRRQPARAQVKVACAARGEKERDFLDRLSCAARVYPRTRLMLTRERERRGWSRTVKAGLAVKGELPRRCLTARCVSRDGPRGVRAVFLRPRARRRKLRAALAISSGLHARCAGGVRIRPGRDC